jgi:predicted enzyme involved in methoxymalonyl-ACP biosynthesis
MHLQPASRRLKTALVYDFDGTLARGNIQESFIKEVGLSPAEFWGQAKQIAQKAMPTRYCATCI